MMDPLPCSNHVWDGVATAQHVAQEVGFDGARPALQGRVGEIAIAGVQAEGVVVQHVNAAERLNGAIHQVLHLFGLTNIGMHRQGASTAACHFVGNARAALSIDVGDDDGGALFRHAQGSGAANTGGAAGDDRDLVLQPAHLPACHLFSPGVVVRGVCRSPDAADRSSKARSIAQNAALLVVTTGLPNSFSHPAVAAIVGKLPPGTTNASITG